MYYLSTVTYTIGDFVTVCLKRVRKMMGGDRLIFGAQRPATATRMPGIKSIFLYANRFLITSHKLALHSASKSAICCKTRLPFLLE